MTNVLHQHTHQLEHLARESLSRLSPLLSTQSAKAIRMPLEAFLAQPLIAVQATCAQQLLDIVLTRMYAILLRLEHLARCQRARRHAARQIREHGEELGRARRPPAEGRRRRRRIRAAGARPDLQLSRCFWPPDCGGGRRSCKHD